MTRSRQPAPQTAIFLHIPKTAGTTLHAIIRQQYAPTEWLHLIGNPHIEPALEAFKTMPPHQKARLRLLSGHFEYGIHQWLPQPAVYFTLLRHPVARVLSYYRFILRTPDHPRHDEMTRRGTTVAQFVRHILSDNNQTRFIAGAWLSGGPVSTPTLEKAKRHIQQDFAVVGLTERFDETALLLKQALRWPSLPHYSSKNVAASGRSTPETLPACALDAILETQQLDVALYDFAQARFEEAVRRRGALFEMQLLAARLRRRAAPLYREARRHSLRHFVRRFARRRPG